VLRISYEEKIMYRLSFILIVLLSSCVPGSITLENARAAAQREMEYAQAKALEVGFTRVLPALCEPQRALYLDKLSGIYQDFAGPLSLRSSESPQAARTRLAIDLRRPDLQPYEGFFDQLETVIPLENEVVQGFVNYNLSPLEGGSLLCIWSGYSDSSKH
jgi:hypothetical protein